MMVSDGLRSGPSDERTRKLFFSSSEGKERGGLGSVQREMYESCCIERLSVVYVPNGSC